MKLSALRVKGETKPGRHNDGNGLYLLVAENGAKSWVLRYKIDGRQRDMGLGGYPGVSLKDAREATEEARRQIRQGVDPIQSRKAARTARVATANSDLLSFQAVAAAYIKIKEPGWKSPKTSVQWTNSLERYAFPAIGAKPVAEIDQDDVLKLLQAIWHRVPETGDRVRGRIEEILDYAIHKGWRTGANPALWRSLRHDLVSPGKVKATVNYPALPWQQLPAFMAELRANPSMSARALELLILTAKRTTEVLGATWQEVNFETATWTIPGERMKGLRSSMHRVPLAPQALELLRGIRPDRAKPESFIFTGLRPKSHLSAMSMLMLMRGMQAPAAPGGVKRWTNELGEPVVPHGFRSAFRDWVADNRTHDGTLADVALGHALRDKVAAAYQRSDLLEVRRPLMTEWAAFATACTIKECTLSGSYRSG
jgi:integrase